MSYNADSVHIIAAKDFGITRAALDAVRPLLGKHVPEASVYEQVESGRHSWSNADRTAFQFDQKTGLWWSGEGSGWSFDAFIAHLLPRFTGSADLVACWEGGDSYTGLRVSNGKVTEREVVRSLGKEIKR